MDNTVGIKISAPGSNVLSDNGSNIIFDTTKPFFKIDTQKTIGFQTIFLTITTEPPTINGTNYTTVYSFAHGYSYKPSIETMFYVVTPPPIYSSYQPYFQEKGNLVEQSVNSLATLYTIADDANVYFIVSKSWDNLSTKPLISGTVVNISCHVFVDDLSGA